MITIKLNIALCGKKFTLVEGDFEPYQSTLDLMTVDVVYDATLKNGFLDCPATITRTIDDELILCFAESVTAPVGACLVIDIASPPIDDDCDDCTPVEGFNTDDPNPLTEGEKRALKMAIINPDTKCPDWCITLGQLKDWVREGLIEDACDLFVKNMAGDIETEPLTAGDKIVVRRNGECKFRQIDPGDLCCDTTTTTTTP